MAGGAPGGALVAASYRRRAVHSFSHDEAGCLIAEGSPLGQVLAGEELGLKGVSRGSVDVRAVFDDAVGGVISGACGGE